MEGARSPRMMTSVLRVISWEGREAACRCRFGAIRVKCCSEVGRRDGCGGGGGGGKFGSASRSIISRLGANVVREEGRVGRNAEDWGGESDVKSITSGCREEEGILIGSGLPEAVEKPIPGECPEGETGTKPMPLAKSRFEGDKRKRSASRGHT